MAPSLWRVSHIQVACKCYLRCLFVIPYLSLLWHCVLEILTLTLLIQKRVSLEKWRIAIVPWVLFEKVYSHVVNAVALYAILKPRFQAHCSNGIFSCFKIFHRRNVYVCTLTGVTDITDALINGGKPPPTSTVKLET